MFTIYSLFSFVFFCAVFFFCSTFFYFFLFFSHFRCACVSNDMLRLRVRKKKKKRDDDDVNDDVNDARRKKKEETNERRDAFFGRRRVRRDTADEKKKKNKRNATMMSWKDVVALMVLLIFFLFVFSLYAREPTKKRTSSSSSSSSRGGGGGGGGAPKVIAIGDIHGDEDVLRRLLFATGATDKVLGEDVRWMRERNERTILVQTGDVVDRGRDSIGSFKFIRDIRNQALMSSSSGDGEDDVDKRQVRLLVGNHELMAIQADYRFIAKEELVALGEAQMDKYGEQEKIHPDSTIGTKALQKVGLLKWKKLFAPNEAFGKEIREFGSVVTVAGEGNCKSAFAHAGVLPEHLREMKIRSEDYDNNDANKKSLDKIINEHYRNSSKGVQMSGNNWQERSQLPGWINGGDGVFWTREPPDASEINGGCDKIKEIVEMLGVKRMVIGHTVQWQGMNSICGGKLVLIDSGMSYAYGGSRREAFVCEGVNGVPMAVDVHGKIRRI